MKKVINLCLILFIFKSHGVSFPDQPSFPGGDELSNGEDPADFTDFYPGGEGATTTDLDSDSLSAGDSNESSTDKNLNTIFGPDSGAAQQYNKTEKKYSYLDPKESKSEKTQIDDGAMNATYKHYSGDCGFAESPYGRSFNQAACAPDDW